MLHVGTEPSAGTSSVWKRQEVTSQWPALESAHTWINRLQCSRANYSPANRSGSPQNGARWGWRYLKTSSPVPQHFLSFWHHSVFLSFLQCSRSCGDGVQTREVRCLAVDKQHSSDCDFESRPAHEQSCNTIPCSPFEGVCVCMIERKNINIWIFEININVVSLFADENCKDRRHNCVMVVQARLCVYSYYKTACCASCTQSAQRAKRQWTSKG